MDYDDEMIPWDKLREDIGYPRKAPHPPKRVFREEELYATPMSTWTTQVFGPSPEDFARMDRVHRLKIRLGRAFRAVGGYRNKEKKQ